MGGMAGGGSPARTFHKRIFESSVLASTKRPLGVKRAWDTGGLPVAKRVFRHPPWPTSHSRSRPSCEPETSVVPSLLKHAAVTGSLCAARVRAHVPARMSQIRTVSSNDPETSSVLWTLKLAQNT